MMPKMFGIFRYYLIFSQTLFRSGIQLKFQCLETPSKQSISYSLFPIGQLDSFSEINLVGFLSLLAKFGLNHLAFEISYAGSQLPQIPFYRGHFKDTLGLLSGLYLSASTVNCKYVCWDRLVTDCRRGVAGHSLHY